ncbi:hypothetical protein BS47DRAFT_1362544 [Hydnum rufescens UP504]|uniref:Uncharacterized protein n=1 Tax=Hydnum rufescens UP504 TaxID=1448309 RepID=A0A9P6DW53_9AGAM|nr:hypothetical protein BS47DRAFT_1362544 [Hydnum rufescens UP504]
MKPTNKDAPHKAQGPQMNHTPTSVDFHLPTTPANPQIKTHNPTEETHENGNTCSKPPTHIATTPRCKTKRVVQMSTTHPQKIQIKPHEMMTHPNRHPPVHKTEYKACDWGAKSVPSLYENPPDNHMGKPPVHAATQAQGACPPKQQLMNTCTTHLPKQVPSPHENPPDKHMEGPPPDTGIDEITYHTPTAAGALSQHENPHTKKGCAQPPATHNPIQEPVTMVQKMSTTHPLQWVCGNFKFVIWTQHPQPHQTNMEE